MGNSYASQQCLRILLSCLSARTSAFDGGRLLIVCPADTDPLRSRQDCSNNGQGRARTSHPILYGAKAFSISGNFRRKLCVILSAWIQRTALNASPSGRQTEHSHWRLPYMTSAKSSNFLTPSPPLCHCHKSADFVPFVCFLGPPRVA